MLLRTLVFTGAFAGAIAVAGTFAAHAATMKFHTDLTAAQEVPPTKSTGKGEATATLDTATHELTVNLTFSGFSSDVTAAHIHGPAAAGKNAGVLVPLGNSPKSPVHVTAKLTTEQEKQLEDGMMYVNVHTKNNPSGAVRGQLTAEK
jgi:hypothetical protein